LSDVIEGGLEAGLLANMPQGDTWLHCTAAPIKEPDGKIVGAMETLQDVTDLIKAGEKLEKARNDLEQKVQERTINLEEANTALKVLLKTKDEAHLQIEEKILFNINELVSPYIEKLKNGTLSGTQRTYRNILESNLNDITSSFSQLFSKDDYDKPDHYDLVLNLSKLSMDLSVKLVCDLIKPESNE